MNPALVWCGVSEVLMSNYIPHYTKKKQVLVRKELALQRSIDRNDSLQELLDAAEQVRDARVRVLQAQRSTIAPMGDADSQYQKIDEQIERLACTKLDAILVEFGFQAASEDNSG